MLNDPNVKVPPDWWCVSLDETSHWRIAEEDQPFIEKMLGIYIFDRAQHTYCCELTPSYFLCYIGDVAVLKPGTPDDVRERIAETYECLNQGDDCYMHVRHVEALPADQKRQYGNVADWEDEDDRGEAHVREHYLGNPVF
jgi:hypothetical protein